MRKFFQRLSRPLQIFTGCSLTMTSAVVLLMMAGVALWQFENSREKAKSPSCMSNMKQISLGFAQYIQDFDEAWPVGTRINRVSTFFRKDTPREAEFHAGQGWAGLTYPYIKNAGVFHCPQDTTVPTEGRPSVSYAYNRNLALNIKLADIGAYDTVVLLAEIEGNCANIGNTEERSNGATYSAAGNGLMLTMTAGSREPHAPDAHYMTGMLGGYGTAGCVLPSFAISLTDTYRHDSGANYAMTDGHVKFHRPYSVSPGNNALNAKQAQNCVCGRAAGTQNLGAFAVTFSTK